jgi:hypothetical protein
MPCATWIVDRWRPGRESLPPAHRPPAKSLTATGDGVGSVSAQVIHLAEFDAVVPQDVVGGGDVEIHVGQQVA